MNTRWLRRERDKKCHTISVFLFKLGLKELSRESENDIDWLVNLFKFKLEFKRFINCLFMRSSRGFIVDPAANCIYK